MIVSPGEQSSLSFKTHMMEGMEGPHRFEIVVTSNDAREPEVVLQVLGDFGGEGPGHEVQH